MVTKIHSRAPTRIDLAGGTVDLWPLYLFLKQPVTVNLGIDLYAEAEIEISDSTADSKPITLRSDDQNLELALTWDELEKEIPVPGSLILHYKLLKYFYEKKTQQSGFQLGSQIRLTTRAKSPAGAGLGGSSTLSIAMIGALAAWASSPTFRTLSTEEEGESFIEIVRDVETTVIQVPAGLQDYYGAMYGGLQSLNWNPGIHHRKKLNPDLISELESRLLLFYSGQSRNSGINNWILFKNFIDQKEEVRKKFQEITDATHRLEKALETRNWSRAGEAIAEEWTVRKTLAAGISTPEIDAVFSSAQEIVPGLSGKVCGAGGGGCFFLYLPTEDPKTRLEQKQAIRKAVSHTGVRPLDFRGVPHGLEVQISRA